MQVCSKCNEEKGKAEFYVSKYLTSGLHSQCKRCVRQGQERRVRCPPEHAAATKVCRCRPCRAPSPFQRRLLVLYNSLETAHHVLLSFEYEFSFPRPSFPSPTIRTQKAANIEVCRNNLHLPPFPAWGEAHPVPSARYAKAAWIRSAPSQLAPCRSMDPPVRSLP